MILKVVHILLAALVFVGSSGFVLNSHLCQDIVRDTTFFMPAEKCSHTEEDQSVCPIHGFMDLPSKDKPSDKDCCDDTSELIKNDDLFIKSQVFFDSEIIQYYPVCQLFQPADVAIDRHSISYLNYKPPLILRDIPVLFETFLC